MPQQNTTTNRYRKSIYEYISCLERLIRNDQDILSNADGELSWEESFKGEKEIYKNILRERIEKRQLIVKLLYRITKRWKILQSEHEVLLSLPAFKNMEEIKNYSQVTI